MGSLGELEVTTEEEFVETDASDMTDMNLVVWVELAVKGVVVVVLVEVEVVLVVKVVIDVLLTVEVMRRVERIDVLTVVGTVE